MGVKLFKVFGRLYVLEKITSATIHKTTKHITYCLHLIYMEFNRLIPELSVSDVKKSLEFYTNILGFKVEYSRERFIFLSFEGSQIMIKEINHVWETGELKKPFGRGINFQIEAKDIKPIIKSLKTNNYPLFRGVKENWYQKENQLLGNREFLVQDPDGYLLRFAQYIGTKKIN